MAAKKDSSTTIAVIFVFIIALLGNYLIVDAHENVHRSIFSIYGIESETENNILWGVTNATEKGMEAYNKLDATDKRIINSMQTINEMTAYYIRTILMILIIMNALMIMVIKR